ncbi:glycosyltransferase family 2 protein [Alicyclobacillus macrosporangiidus]|uniref:Glycosyltransferase, catalytic subunit of cellulose synthase and poly-beta-1,6-N-acetylglucosamine synthase n=1 Tax=Alicyclobacillus macrosporangiidus TaxID=392015 RepID=A0A1I7JH73_9BACL|nr:glycosyltransferase [Alicyclobacillus macrosporangiidus]SFU84482.1 Glycosyltransferase, catalytic subunit of cellulose synthase and poly-beta-1,6-N-acetylglucosamine synthase [Alicyclobacillus macrosporangiidus]
MKLPDIQANLSLSDVLLEQGLITHQELSRAYAYQEKFGGNLKHVLRQLGYLQPYKLKRAIAQGVGRTPLGERLVSSGVLTREQLEYALAIQRRSGGRLGDILISSNLASPRAIYNALAEQLKEGRVDERFELRTARKLPEKVARALNAVVLDEDEHVCTLAVAELLSPEGMNTVRSYIAKPVRQVLATPYELEQLWKIVYSDEMVFESVDRLAVEQPENSASRVLSRRQLFFILAVLCMLAYAFIRAPQQAAMWVNVFCQFVYVGMAVFKARILYNGVARGAKIEISATELEQLNERELPVYTILVPLYKEASVLPTLVEHIEALDYPKHKLDVRLLLEEDDQETLQAARAMKLPYNYTFVVVPNMQPKTKPKACNYGLIRARGEYVVIYDAEDRPEPDQLKKAVVAFRKLPESYACVQAKLNYYNGSQNLLTRWFTQEYSTWFGLLLPGVMTMNIPLPLGGTSNHFKANVLRRVGAWDPYNVTEDADLGIRLYKHGYQTAVVDSTTWEEANSRFKNWIRQRSRWIKGYLQTWLVHMRHPVRLYKELGHRGFWGFQAVVLGTPLLAIMNPFFWGLMGLWYVARADWIPALFPGVIYYMAAILLILGNFFFVYSHVVGMYQEVERDHRQKRFRLSYGLVVSAVWSPLYWGMMSLAAYRAIWQLIRRPFYWDKTVHGLVKEPSVHAKESERNVIGGISVSAQ